MLDRRAIRLAQRGELRRRGQRGQYVVERTVLHHLQMVLDQTRLPRRMGLTQLGRVGDCLQMRHRRPQARDRGVRALQRHPCLGKAGRPGLHDMRHRRAVIGQQSVERGGDLVGPDFAEMRQRQRVEQRVRHHASFSHQRATVRAFGRDRMGIVPGQIAFGLQRRHAAHARRGDGLAEQLVLNVARREDACHAGRVDPGLTRI